MDTNQHASSPRVGRRHRMEGPRNHIISFLISIVLTSLAFIAVNYREQFNESFVVPFILMMAVFQAVIQLAFWMHLKDKGHGLIAIFFAFGAIIAFAAVVAAEYWMWW